MEDLKSKARELMRQFKGDAYAFGLGAIEQAGELASPLGGKFLLVRDQASEINGMLEGLQTSFEEAGLTICAECLGAAPNSPIDDVERVRDEILAAEPDAVVAVGGGSLIDAVKGSVVLATLGGTCDDYFGVGKVTARLEETGKQLIPFFAVMTAAASGAHLTKYSNLTNMRTYQKKLFIDPAVVAPVALFDYRATVTMPPEFTMVGAFDGICHILEVYFGVPLEHEQAARVEEIAMTGLELIVASLPGTLKQPACEDLRESIGLGTDLGGYAIMIGSTNGAHLNSFSLVDLMDHGKATALLEPYYTCFFAPAIEGRLRKVGKIYQRHGYIDSAEDLDGMPSPGLGLTVSQGMAALAESVGFPTTLGEVEGFSNEHVQRMLSAAKDPALASKLQGMPIPMTPEDVDKYMGPVLAAARTGDFSLIVPHEDYA
ncbi:MAG: iron-containing alcohol dehydrogenase [Planctomycetota bacterium]|jgi:alcohol dehydrogenase